eukprot:1137855-Pelagomonas_calceolata.AAC.3
MGGGERQAVGWPAGAECCAGADDLQHVCLLTLQLCPAGVPGGRWQLVLHALPAGVQSTEWVD